MDFKTEMCLLAVGSFVYAYVLLVFNNKRNPQRVPFWNMVKIMQSAGFLMLCFWSEHLGLIMLANILLLLGCAYEAWTVFILLGQNVKRRWHVITAIMIISVCLLSMHLDKPYL